MAVRRGCVTGVQPTSWRRSSASDTVVRMDATAQPRRAHRALAAFVASSLLSIAALPWAAAQGDLYGPEAPVDAAWVRVLNVATDGVDVRIGDAAAQELGHHEATPYALVDPGEVRVDVGGDVHALTVAPESFTTVAATADGVVVVPDPALRDISRGLLGLLNLTIREGLDLRVPDGPVVVAAVPPGAHDAVAVAEASTALVVVDADVEVARVEERPFARGVAYTVVVVDTAEGVVAFVLTAAGE
jgi:hypothetical protein